MQPHSAFGKSNSILSTRLNILDTSSTRTDSKILSYSSVAGLASVLPAGFRLELLSKFDRGGTKTWRTGSSTNSREKLPLRRGIWPNATALNLWTGQA